MSALQRSISSSNLDHVARIKQRILEDQKPAPAVDAVPYFDVLTAFSFVIPFSELDRERPLVQEAIFEGVLHRGMQKRLEVEEKLINWHPGCVNLSCLKTLGDGNCLMHSASLAMWGIHDRDLILRSAVYTALTHSRSRVLFERWQSDRRREMSQINASMDAHVWEAEYQHMIDMVNPRRHSSRMDSLTDFHIFVLANVLRRPIIVYSTAKVHSMATGSSFGPNNIPGIYIPLLWNTDCISKDPITLAYAGSHFSALVPGDRLDRNYLPTVPLCDRHGRTLPVKFLLPNETNAEDVLRDDYISTTTIRTSSGSIPVAQVNLASQPELKQFWKNHIERKKKSAYYDDPPQPRPRDFNPDLHRAPSYDTATGSGSLKCVQCNTPGAHANTSYLCKECYENQLKVAGISNSGGSGGPPPLRNDFKQQVSSPDSLPPLITTVHPQAKPKDPSQPCHYNFNPDLLRTQSYGTATGTVSMRCAEENQCQKLSLKGQNYFVVGTVPNDYICPICQDLLDEPQLTRCGHLFCHKCLKSCKNRTSKSLECPLCRALCEDTFPDARSKRQIQNLQVACMNAPCTWTGSLCELSNHRNGLKCEGCLYEAVTCPNDCQTTNILRKDLVDHQENACPLRKEACKHCRVMLQHRKMADHFMSSCQEYPIQCPNKCGKKNIPLKDITAHILECPESEMTCPYERFGCNGKFPRKHLQKHKDEVKDHHLQLTLDHVSQLTDVVAHMYLWIDKHSDPNDPILRESLPRSPLFDHRKLHDRPWLKNKSVFPSMPWIVKMDNYSQYEKKEWISCTFYTHPVGYNVRLRVIPGAQRVTIILDRLKGTNDDWLPALPSDNLIIITLLNQLEDNFHHTECIQTGQWVSGLKFSIGNEDMSRKDKKCEYLRDDCMFFSVAMTRSVPKKQCQHSVFEEDMSIIDIDLS